LKKLLLGLTLTLALLGTSALQAQSVVPDTCIVTVSSIPPIAQERGRGLTKAEVHGLYNEMLAGAGKLTKEQQVIVERVRWLIDEVFRLTPFNEASLNALMDREFALCLKVQGNYDKVKVVKQK
jgi:hypothetical protein